MDIGHKPNHLIFAFLSWVSICRESLVILILIFCMSCTRTTPPGPTISFPGKEASFSWKPHFLSEKRITVYDKWLVLLRTIIQEGGFWHISWIIWFSVFFSQNLDATTRRKQRKNSFYSTSSLLFISRQVRICLFVSCSMMVIARKATTWVVARKM